METLFLKGLLSGRPGGGEKRGSVNEDRSSPALGKRHAVTERTLRLEDTQASASALPFNGCVILGK